MQKRRPLTRINEPERWRQIGDNLYVSDQGRCKRIYNGKEYEVGHWSKDASKRVNVVKIGTVNVPIKNLVWKAFRGEIPHGYCVVHKGMKRDDSLYSLECIPKKKLASKTGMYANSQKVVDLDRKRIYRSASEAGRRLNCSRQAITSTCRGETKRPMFNVAWWDEENERAYRGQWRGETE